MKDVAKSNIIQIIAGMRPEQNKRTNDVEQTCLGRRPEGGRCQGGADQTPRSGQRQRLELGARTTSTHRLMHDHPAPPAPTRTPPPRLAHSRGSAPFRSPPASKLINLVAASLQMDLMQHTPDNFRRQVRWQEPFIQNHPVSFELRAGGHGD